MGILLKVKDTPYQARFCPHHAMTLTVDHEGLIRSIEAT